MKKTIDKDDFIGKFRVTWLVEYEPRTTTNNGPEWTDWHAEITDCDGNPLHASSMTADEQREFHTLTEKRLAELLEKVDEDEPVDLEAAAREEDADARRKERE